MPIRTEFTEDGIGVILHHEGVVTGEELFGSIARVYEGDKFKSLKYWIGDRTKCTEFLPDSDCLRMIAELNKKMSALNPQILLALVASNDLQFGMSRMFEAFSEDSYFITKVFRDRDSAEEWIRQNLENPHK